MDLKNTNVYFNEYLFQQMIQNENKRLLEIGERVITTSQARALHKKFLQALPNGHDMSTIGPKDFIAAATSVLPDSPSAPDGNTYRKYVAEFSDITGIAPKVKQGVVRTENPALPLSPYDERFADRAVFRQNGSKLLYVKEEDIETFGETFDENTLVYKQDFNKKLREVGPAITGDDYSGMSLLMPYLSESDYKAVVGWVNKVGEKDRSKYMTKEAIERSCEILKELQNDGTAYTVTCDANVGQIKANLTGTKISVRLTDSRENERYIGRVYDNGLAIYYTTNKKVAGDNRLSAYTNLSAKDSVRLLKFAQGKSVDRNDTNEPAGKAKTYKRGIWTNKGPRRELMYNEAYHSGKNYSEVVGVYPGDNRSRVLIHVDSSRSNSSLSFKGSVAAESYLRESVTSARENFIKSIDLDMLVKEASKHYGEDDYFPAFSGDGGIAAIQQSYWEVLMGRQGNVLKPGFSMDEYTDRVASIKAVDVASENFNDFMLSDMIYDNSLSNEEKVRQHMLDNTDYLIGSFERDYDGKRFDPVNVSSYMTSEYGKYRNNDNIIAALRASGINPEELKGDDFYNKTIKDKLITFNERTARPMTTIANPFIQTMFSEIKTTLSETGCIVNDKDILLDENGIVRYTASKVDVERVRADGTYSKQFTGEIGQLFIPDDLGLVETKFAGSDNYLFTPGYEAYVLPQAEGEDKTLEERTRLKGFEQLMGDGIRYQIRSDILSDGLAVGGTTSVNNVYRRLYDTRYPLDLVTQSQLDGMSEDLLHDIIETNARRVRYGNELKDNSTINADYQAGVGSDYEDITNDNYQDYYSLTGRRNMSIMTEDGDGYFDPAATGTSTNQGITRYLVESAKVNPDGSIVRGDLDDMTPLMKNRVCKYMEHNPFDRRQMTFNNLLKASCVTDSVKTAQMTFGGWTFDDGYVVSKEFAKRYQIRGSNDEMRALIKGDKISDMNGNKGVISLVIDPDMTVDAIATKMKILEDTFEPTDSEGWNLEGVCELNGQTFNVSTYGQNEDSTEIQIAKQIQQALGYGDTEEAIAWFKANPELDVVGAPFPAPSRFNGGSARELMENPSDLVAPDGTVHKGCIGEAHYIVTHMAVDEKTHIYGEDELAQGKGRKASAQLAWAFASQGATEILKECYGSNNGAVANLREMMITMGLDMDETGTMRVGYKPHNGEVRKVFEMPQLEYKMSKATAKKPAELKLDARGMKRKFGDIIAQSGGILEVPFALKYPTGDIIPPLNDGKTDVVYTKREWERKGYVRKDGVHVRATTVRRHDDASTERAVPTTYGLPVLSSYLRSGQEFADGTSTVHDYTNHYLRIYESALYYKDAEKNNDTAAMEKMQRQAQAEYEKITEDLKARKFTGKHNVFRDNIMANRIPHSATAVWTADPRLDIDQVAMGPEMAESLGLKDNEYTLMWRDPMLRDAGVRYLRTKIDKSLVGVAINPAMDKSFDGDFDGDSVGLMVLQSRTAKNEAMAKFTVDTNLLDYGIKDPKTGKFELMMQHSLDMKSAAYENPELAIRRLEITEEVNGFESSKDTMNPRQLRKLRNGTVKELSELTRKTFAGEFGNDMICHADMQSHLKSVEHMVINGAKGNYNKLKDYARYLGIEYDRVPESVDKSQPIDLNTVKDLGKPIAGRKDDMAVQYATAIKSFGTGDAGTYSQRGFSALRNIAPKAVLELTYPVTQSILQSKHDPIEAKHKYEMLQSTCRDLWRGVKLDKFADKDTGEIHWKAVRNNKGRTIQASPEEFKKQFMDIYTTKEGLNVEINEDYVDMIKDALTGTDVYTGKTIMQNIEREGKEENAAPMDKLAYGGTFDTLCELARDNANLFDGKYNQHFAPKSILKNIQALEKGEDVKAITKSDIKEGSKPKNKDVIAVSDIDVPKSKNVTGIPRREIPDVDTCDAECKNGDFGE